MELNDVKALYHRPLLDLVFEAAGVHRANRRRRAGHGPRGCPRLGGGQDDRDDSDQREADHGKEPDWHASAGGRRRCRFRNRYGRGRPRRRPRGGRLGLCSRGGTLALGHGPLTARIVDHGSRMTRIVHGLHGSFVAGFTSRVGAMDL